MFTLQNSDLLKTQCLVGEGWVDAEDGATIDVTNPFNGELLGSIPSLSQSQIEKAVADSEQAQIGWAALTAAERAKLLHKWADLIDEKHEDLAV